MKYKLILTGKLKKGLKLAWLLIYLIEKDVLVLTLVDTGTHSDICLIYKIS